LLVDRHIFRLTSHTPEDFMSNEPLVYTIPQAAKELAVSRSTIYRLIGEGQLETISVRSHRRVRRSALVRYLDALQRQHRESTVRF
jgi:excisionase family DNA binding protein